MKTTKTAKTGTPTRGTAKAHGLKVGDTFVYYGKDKAPGTAAAATLVNTNANGGVWLVAARKPSGKPIETIGGPATKFWAAPAVTLAPKKAKADAAINGQCECHLIALVVEPTVKLTKTQKANSRTSTNGLVEVHYQCSASTDRRFAPGHDARYHGIEALAARVGISPVYFTEDDLPRSMR